jgi:hypothetical protein
LSATGSRNAPKEDTWLSLRAKVTVQPVGGGKNKHHRGQSGCDWRVQFGQIKHPTIRGIAKMRVQVMMVGMVKNMVGLWHGYRALRSTQGAVNFLRQFARDAFHRRNIFHAGQCHTPHTPKTLQQLGTPFGANAGNLFQLATTHPHLGALERACR